MFYRGNEEEFPSRSFTVKSCFSLLIVVLIVIPLMLSRTLYTTCLCFKPHPTSSSLSLSPSPLHLSLSPSPVYHSLPPLSLIPLSPSLPCPSSSQSKRNKDSQFLLESLAGGRFVKPFFLVDVHAPAVQGLFYGLSLREKKAVATESTFTGSTVMETMKGEYVHFFYFFSIFVLYLCLLLSHCVRPLY